MRPQTNRQSLWGLKTDLGGQVLVPYNEIDPNDTE